MKTRTSVQLGILLALISALVGSIQAATGAIERGWSFWSAASCCRFDTSRLVAINAQQVYALLQASYAEIGGIKGNGFENKEDMIANILFWKMAIKDGKVEVAIIYKDKGGRKSVAIGSTGSAWARIKIADMFKNEIKRSYGEKSKSALGLMLKVFPENAIKPFLHTPEVAGKTLKKEVTPIKDVPKDQWPDATVLWTPLL
jgi:hypothetical protein